MTEMPSDGAIADHRATPQYRAGAAYFRTPNVVMTMSRGVEVRATLIRSEPHEPLLTKLSYSDRTLWEAKLHSTDAGDVTTPQFKRGAVWEM
jgi:hypothetical protein